VAQRDPAPVGVTVYGCEPDEAELFTTLSPRFGIIPTISSAPVSDSNVISVPRNRCISVGHKTELSAPMLRALRDAGVEHLSTRSIGLDHIDLDTAATLGMAVENVVYAPDGVADFTLMLILMVIRNAKAVVDAADRHDFRLGGVRGRDLRDLTVGVVGVGNIGEAVVRRLRGFGCRVLAHSNRRSSVTGAHFVSLDELLRQSDVVTLHVPLDPDTHHLVGRKQIETMKRGAFLVNTGRGALVDTDALVAALECGKLGGAALDVLEGEDGIFYVDCTDRPIDNHLLLRLQQLPNVIVMPHTAYYTTRALHDTVEATLASCRTFERNRGHGHAEDRDRVRRLFGGA
jgi:D-specific alpha-keto acid dehydrogenase